MLVANPGQTASYTLIGSTTKIPHNSNSSSLAAHINNSSTLHKVSKLSESSTTTLAQTLTSSTRTATALMKSLSVRLNRSTEYLKGTVQKALLNTTVAAAAAISSTASTSYSAKAVLPTLSPPLLSSTLIPTQKFLKLYTVPPTIYHHFPDRKVNASDDDDDDDDSIDKELCYFKPIKPAALTPFKISSKTRGPSLKTPNAVRAKTTLLNCDDTKTYEKYKPKPNSLDFTVDLNSTSFVLLDKDYKSVRPKTATIFTKKAAKQKSPNKRRGRRPKNNDVPSKKASNKKTKIAPSNSLRASKSGQGSGSDSSGQNTAPIIPLIVRKLNANAKRKNLASNTLKRKITQTENDEVDDDELEDGPSIRKKLKKQNKPTKIGNNIRTKKDITIKDPKTVRPVKRQNIVADAKRETPPLTRSRLRRTNDEGLLSGLNIRQRCI